MHLVSVYRSLDPGLHAETLSHKTCTNNETVRIKDTFLSGRTQVLITLAQKTIPLTIRLAAIASRRLPSCPKTNSGDFLASVEELEVLRSGEALGLGFLGLGFDHRFLDCFHLHMLRTVRDTRCHMGGSTVEARRRIFVFSERLVFSGPLLLGWRPSLLGELKMVKLK